MLLPPLKLMLKHLGLEDMEAMVDIEAMVAMEATVDIMVDTVARGRLKLRPSVDMEATEAMEAMEDMEAMVDTMVDTVARGRLKLRLSVDMEATEAMEAMEDMVAMEAMEAMDTTAKQIFDQHNNVRVLDPLRFPIFEINHFKI